MKKLRIAFFTDTWFPNVDGVVFALNHYRKELERKGHTVYVYAAGDPKAKGADNGLRVRYFSGPRFPLYPQYSIALHPFRAVGQARKDKIDVVHCHGIAGMGIAAIQTARKLRIPLIATFHTMIPIAAHRLMPGPEPVKKLASKIAWKVLARFYKQFDIVTTPGATVARLLRENGLGRVVIVPNGIDTKLFSPNKFTKKQAATLKLKLGIDSKKRVVAYVGRLSKEKNVDLLLRAAAAMKKHGEDFQILVGGDGPAAKNLHKLAQDLGLGDTVKFTGFIPNKLLPLYYKMADVYATASTFETQSLSLMEAMACGKVCVGAAALAIPDAITHGENGFLFKPFSSADCAKQLSKALKLPATRRRKIEQTARKGALQYSISQSTKKLENLYEKAISAG